MNIFTIPVKIKSGKTNKYFIETGDIKERSAVVIQRINQPDDSALTVERIAPVKGELEFHLKNIGDTDVREFAEFWITYEQ